jgi:DNA-directed RNA polymerase specialized sigma24 family protein
VEDAVATAFLQALERPAAFDRAAERGGTDELVSFMHLVARRQLRQDCRKKSFRSELHLDELPERLTADDPESRLRANELGARVSAKLDEATLLYGGRSKDKFRVALGERLASGAPDTRVARAHGVPRENLCRARHWLMREMRAA